MNVLGVTLARGGSKGVPRKNIRPIAGKPLLAYTVEEALKCTLITKYAVSSDDPEILAVAFKYGANVIERPKRLAQDDTPHLPALVHALDWAEDFYNKRFGVVADLRCTNPFKTALDIDMAIKKLIKTDADVVVGVSKLEDHHPSRIKLIYNDRLHDVWPEPESGRRQDLGQDVYIRNGSIYIVKSEILRAGYFFVGQDLVIRPHIMPPERGINIDTKIDFLLAEAMLK
jgi:CMP-N,N'-diacetyllegionaminic acid synthase